MNAHQRRRHVRAVRRAYEIAVQRLGQQALREAAGPRRDLPPMQWRNIRDLDPAFSGQCDEMESES